MPRPWPLTRGPVLFENGGLKRAGRDLKLRLGGYEAAACVVSSRLHPALPAVASGLPAVALSSHPKVMGTFSSMGHGECVVGPAGATTHQLAAAVVDTQAVPATWEVEEASRSAGWILTGGPGALEAEGRGDPVKILATYPPLANGRGPRWMAQGPAPRGRKR